MAEPDCCTDSLGRCDQAKAQRDAVTAMSKVDALTKSSLSNEQKRAEAIKDYKKQLDDIRKVDPKDSRLDPAAVANSTQQGLPVPVFYGKMLVGSSVVAIGTWAEAIPA